MKVVNNQVVLPFREGACVNIYGVGISKLGEVLDLGVKAGVVEQSGS